MQQHFSFSSFLSCIVAVSGTTAGVLRRHLTSRERMDAGWSYGDGIGCCWTNRTHPRIAHMLWTCFLLKLRKQWHSCRWSLWAAMWANTGKCFEQWYVFLFFFNFHQFFNPQFFPLNSQQPSIPLFHLHCLRTCICSPCAHWMRNICCFDLSISIRPTRTSRNKQMPNRWRSTFRLLETAFYSLKKQIKKCGVPNKKNVLKIFKNVYTYLKTKRGENTKTNWVKNIYIEGNLHNSFPEDICTILGNFGRRTRSGCWSSDCKCRTATRCVLCSIIKNLYKILNF